MEISIDKIYALLILIISSLGFRLLLQSIGQRWVVTYAHTFTIVALPVITFVITSVISGNIALSLGMVGALSIVRFRNPVRSPLELCVYFASITMGISASVNIKWLIFFILSILLVIIVLSLASKISILFFKKSFFFTSFTEGNSLSTLEITTEKSITLLDESKFIRSKTSDQKLITYFLASDNFEKLKQLVVQLENEEINFKYQLNTG
ncbi:DUF4956 domain-containing protein [Candidatus Pelagibacter sp.]|nr:DUF4956 domain-containing protein [Candidatus Pelagibacter sp.]